MNPNDEIRHKILRYFYNRMQNATSRTGKRGAGVTISDVKSELKAAYGLSQQQVVSNLTYLIDRGWVKEFSSEKQFVTKAGTKIPSVSYRYQISALGTDKIEGDSEFKPRERYPGINVTSSGQTVIMQGDGNVVNASFSSLHEQLEHLKEEVTVAPELSDAQKLDVVVDIESIKDQLAKPEPNRNVVSHLWHGIEGVVTAGHFAELVARVAVLMGPLLTNG